MCSVLFKCYTPKIRYLPLLFAHFLTPLLSTPFSLPFPSSSQVGIHHRAGGHLSSDSFVNVNYCSLSRVVSARESSTCRAAHCLLRRTQNNQPIGLLCSDSPFLNLSHAHLLSDTRNFSLLNGFSQTRKLNSSLSYLH